MSKERRQRRSAREHEAAVRAAARAAEAERRERRPARTVGGRLRRLAGGRSGGSSTPGRRGAVGRDTGALAQRRRRARGVLVTVLLTLNVLVWIAFPGWGLRLAALVVSLLVFPVLAVLATPQRR